MGDKILFTQQGLVSLHTQAQKLLKCQTTAREWLINSKEINMCHQVSTRGLTLLFQNQMHGCQQFPSLPLLRKESLKRPEASGKLWEESRFFKYQELPELLVNQNTLKKEILRKNVALCQQKTLNWEYSMECNHTRVLRIHFADRKETLPSHSITMKDRRTQNKFPHILEIK